MQTARRYDCFCTRALNPRTDAAIAPAPCDPLDEVIERAHAAGLEVHAWVNVNPWGTAPLRPAPPTTSSTGTARPPGGTDRWLTKTERPALP
ncbi:hypothetical protein [Streptomyces sp. NBC_01803]|uniref:hypothetical protein n=1 Tax=Streptomyces sp. NBC_01803 TaxID=2975946 RepID=UPI002DD8005D|nr:hypothetical protein [Streptomyces sp. NBC_01803]WSA43958.1 hypothetical protein OIE51_06940 [Streptomyces sp. NBC_01803]